MVVSIIGICMPFPLTHMAVVCGRVGSEKRGIQFASGRLLFLHSFHLAHLGALPTNRLSSSGAPLGHFPRRISLLEILSMTLRKDLRKNNMEDRTHVCHVVRVSCLLVILH